MKIRPIFDQSCAGGSATTTGSTFRMDASGNDDSVIVVQFYTGAGALNDIALQGRLSAHSSGASTNWATLTTGGGGAIQIVPRCLEYRAQVVNTNASAQTFACYLGL